MPVEDRSQLTLRHLREWWAVRIVSFVVVKHEIVELELVAVLMMDAPIQECIERIPLHDAVKQRAYLIRSPHELPLDGGQYELVTLNLI